MRATSRTAHTTRTRTTGAGRTRRHRTARTVGAAVTLALGVAGLTAPAAQAGAQRAESRLAFVRSGEIYTATLSGTHVRRLTGGAGSSFRPHWSPGGERIAYVHETPAGSRDVWVMRADGSHKRQVTHLGDTTEPSWSPDGRRLAFGGGGAAPYGTRGAPLMTVRSSAPFGSPTVLTGVDGEDPLVLNSLAFSPDGTRIAYYSDSFPDSPDHYLLIYTRATQEVSLVDLIGGECCGEGYFGDPTWTPDGADVAYTQLRQGLDGTSPTKPVITVRSATTGDPVPFTSLRGDADPDYSPSGTQLVFRRLGYVVRAHADGTHRDRLLRGAQPDWRP